VFGEVTEGLELLQRIGDAPSHLPPTDALLVSRRLAPSFKHSCEVYWLIRQELRVACTQVMHAHQLTFVAQCTSPAVSQALASFRCKHPTGV
jgi:hypothetical protein